MASYKDPRDESRESAASRETTPKMTERTSQTKAAAKAPPAPAPVITDWASI
jgi:hypothetical protein